MDFDVTTIDPASVRLVGVDPIRSAIADVATPYELEIDACDACNELASDGFQDLSLKFDNQDVLDALGDVADGECLELLLTGQLVDGTLFGGEDVVVILNKEKE